mgnify:CR=1 FL=1
MKREFKDLIRLEQYEYLNNEITGDYDETHAVKCLNGTFVGTEENGVASWLGIPYAKPPVGERRFKAPEYVDADDRVFEAKYYGKCAIESDGYPDNVQKLHSEDCLYLNIWVNEDDKTAKKPVMVWIHGGAYVVGSGSQASYSGANLVQKQSDIIMLTINYRLNMYGFMDFSSVPGGENFRTAPCNGLLDQAMALRWVHENIAAFGGDPDRITVLGFESGATSICLLAASERAKGLFQKAVILNGGPVSAYDTPEASRKLAKDLLKQTRTSSMDILLQLNTETLKDAAQKLWMDMCAPTCDGTLIPADVYAACQEGTASGIEFVIGITSGKMQVFRSESKTGNALQLTMVCAQGLKPNAHSWDVARIVTADDLFS